MKVLVAIDNKPSSQAIIDALVKMHWFEGTELHLITVRPNAGEHAHSPDELAGCTLEEIENLAVDLHNCLRHCEVTFLAPQGDPRMVIMEMSQQIGADLIVIGSNCKNTLERLLIGSVAQTVMNQAHCPVIVAKTPCCLAREASPGFKNILVPIDNSIFADAAIRWLSNFSWSADTRFIVCAVVEENSDFEEVEQSLNKRALDLSALVNSTNIVLETATGEARPKIIELAKKHYADLIVMGSHGRTGLKKLILGSVSQTVSHEAPCAVAIVRGLVADDGSWLRTGTFHKLKPIESPKVDTGYRDYDDVSVRILPSGI